MRLLFIELITAALFVSTTGFLFRERFERNPYLVAIVAALLFAGTYFVIEELGRRFFGPVLGGKPEISFSAPPVVQSTPDLVQAPQQRRTDRFCATVNGRLECE